MTNLDTLYEDILNQADEPKKVQERKTLTLRLPLTVHNKLQTLVELTGSTKTVVSEDVLIGAIEDLYQRLLNDTRLETWWMDRAGREAEDDEYRAWAAQDEHTNRQVGYSTPQAALDATIAVMQKVA